jgi:hypothetical protein
MSRGQTGGKSKGISSNGSVWRIFCPLSPIGAAQNSGEPGDFGDFGPKTPNFACIDGEYACSELNELFAFEKVYINIF